MSNRRIVKSAGDLKMTEVTQSDGKSVISRAYAVGTRDPKDHKTFGDMGSADAYYDVLRLRALNPPK